MPSEFFKTAIRTFHTSALEELVGFLLVLCMGVE